MKPCGDRNLLKKLNLGWVLGMLFLAMFLLTVAATFATSAGLQARDGISAYETGQVTAGITQQGRDQLKERDRDRTGDQVDLQGLDDGTPQQDRDRDQDKTRDGDKTRDRDRDQLKDGSCL